MKKLLPLFLLSVTVWSQTARYPSAIATTADLTDLADRAQTTLNAPLNSSATSFTVVSAAKFSANMILTIDSEQMKVCQVSGNTVSIGNTSCPNVDGRGFSGTAAASHSNGALVSNYFVAYQFKATREEIKAIETALGVNLANVSALFPNPVPVNKGGTGVTAAQGNGSKVQLSTGSTTTGDLVSYDSSGNTQDSGVPSAKQGNGSKIQLAGTNSGVSGAGLCNDAGGNATTSGCTPLLPAGSQNQYLRIQPNTGNSTTYQFASPTVNAADYNFPAQTPSGSLTAAVGAAVTLTPCPLGVSGTHTVAAGLPHLLYLSTVGTAEAVVITGGTCTGDGVASGTIQFTPANNHANGYTIKSNSSGIQEAIYTAGATGRVQLPCQTLDLWGNTATVAAIEVPDAWSTAVHGCGVRSTTLLKHGLTGDWFTYDWTSTVGASVEVGDFGMMTSSGTSATAGSDLKVRYRNYGTVSNILMGYAYDGLIAEGSGSNYKDLTIFHARRGITFTCSGVSSVSCTSAGRVLNSSTINELAGAVGLYITDTTTGITVEHSIFGSGVSGSTNSTTAIAIVGTSAGSFNEIMISNSFLDATTVGLSIVGNGASYGTGGLQVLNNHIAAAQNGITISAFVQGVRIENNTISALLGFGGTANDRGINLGNNVINTVILGNTIESDGDGCITLGGTSAADYDIIGNRCNGGASATTSTYALQQAVTVTRLRVRDNNFSVSGTAPWIPSGTPIASGNSGIDDVIPAVASAATLAFPVNPTFTLTGTTGVTAVTVPFAAGAKFTFVATNASPGAWTAGASIGNTFTPTQNVPVNCMWDGTKVWCK